MTFKNSPTTTKPRRHGQRDIAATEELLSETYSYLLDSAAAQLQTESTDNTLHMCRTAAAFVPDRARAYLLMTEAATRERDMGALIQACRELIRLDPTCVEAYVHLEMALMRVGDTTSALEATRMLTLLEPDSAPHYLRLGDLYQHCGDLPSAIHCYNDALNAAASTEESEEAREALELLDILQLNQIAALAMADSHFRNCLLESPTETSESRGFFLSSAGENMLRDFCAYSLAHVPQGEAPRYH
jgi:tetratricopeptide (TPR) repeat protein